MTDVENTMVRTCEQCGISKENRELEKYSYLKSEMVEVSGAHYEEGWLGKHNTHRKYCRMKE